MVRQPIRILQALTKSDIGGTELSILRLVQRLDRSRFASTASFLDGYGPITSRFQCINVPVHDLSGRGGPFGVLRRFITLLRDSRFRIISLYGFRMSLLGRLAVRFVSPRPIVVHGIRGFHVTEGEEVHRLRTRMAVTIERQASHLVDVYIANSQGAVNFLSACGIPARKFIVIPNGIDVSEWPMQTRPADSPELTVICVANFRPVKRHNDLIDSIALLQQRGVRGQYLFVGDGSIRREAEERVRQHNLTARVEFTGSRPPHEVRALLQAADIFVLCSLWEGMPGSVMEAMATGLPVIGTDAPGINELVVNGVTGYLVPIKGPQELAARLQQLIENPALRLQMGVAGRRRIEEMFSLGKMVERYENIYSSLLKTRGELL